MQDHFRSCMSPFRLSLRPSGGEVSDMNLATISPDGLPIALGKLGGMWHSVRKEKRERERERLQQYERFLSPMRMQPSVRTKRNTTTMSEDMCEKVPHCFCCPMLSFPFRVSVSGLCLLLQQTHCDCGTVKRGITRLGAVKIWKTRGR